MKTLYQFAFSHFCEKARWALDYKGQAYRIRNLVPGAHVITTRRLAPKSSVPILVSDGRVIQGSSAIIDYLDTVAPVPVLTPSEPELSREARRWETYLDEEVGVTLRCWFYFHMLPRRDLSMKFMLSNSPWYGRPLLNAGFGRMRRAMMKQMRITSQSASEAERRLGEALMKINKQIERQSFLVGNGFTRADLSACALLAPLCLPDQEILRMLPGPVLNFRQMHVDLPVFRWMVRTYREYRLKEKGSQ